jgi:hypothetical protein
LIVQICTLEAALQESCRFDRPRRRELAATLFSGVTLPRE